MPLFRRADDSVTLQEALDTLALLRVPESTNKLLSLFWEGQSDTVPMEIALQV